MKAWTLVLLHSLGPWTFSEMKPSQKSHSTAILVSAIDKLLFSIISPEPHMITQKRWCLYLYYNDTIMQHSGEELILLICEMETRDYLPMGTRKPWFMNMLTPECSVIITTLLH